MIEDDFLSEIYLSDHIFISRVVSFVINFSSLLKKGSSFFAEFVAHVERNQRDKVDEVLLVKELPAFNGLKAYLTKEVDVVN